MMAPDPKNLLLAATLEPDQVQSLLQPYGFQDIQKADANLQLIANEPRSRLLLSEILESLLDCFARSPDPDQALTYFERFTQASYSKNQLLAFLKDSPYTQWLLAKLFGSSPFLSEILIRNPNYLHWITQPRILDKGRSRKDLKLEILASLGSLKTKKRTLEVLCILKRKELLRIGVRDLLKKASVEEITLELSDLADVLIERVYEISEKFLRQRLKDRGRRGAFSILGMGKLGGRELNFSSDVDLLYLYEPEDEKPGAKVNPQNRISDAEYFKRLSQEITSGLHDMTDEGHLYRVDLRLRPEGGAGEIAYSLNAYAAYYASRAETWERLALLKARPIAGSSQLGQKFLNTISGFIYRSAFSQQNFQEVRNLKGRIDQKLAAGGKAHRNVKLGFGGIREIEFSVQSLQLFFGRDHTDLRERNTLKALEKLYQANFIPKEIYRQFYEAYVFLRNVEHSLQMVHAFQTHNLPNSTAETRKCALRLGYEDHDSGAAEQEFLNALRHHTCAVHRIFRYLFYDIELQRIFSKPGLLFKNFKDRGNE